MSASFKEIEPSPQTYEIEASVVFIHGIWGDASASWSLDPNNEDALWPKWLARSYPRLKVFSVDYATEAVRKGMRIDQRAVNLLAELKTLKVFEEKPFILVCHSMGGLIAKQLLLDAEVEGLDFIVKNHAGTVFFATPHRGSKVAETINLALPAAIISRQLRDLALNNSYVESLFRNYKQYAKRNSRVAHKNFHETRKTLAFRIVEELSSEDGLDQGMSVPLDYNHFKICKFAGTDDARFSQVKQFIEVALAAVDLTKADEAYHITVQAPKLNGGALHFIACFIANVLCLAFPWVFLVLAPVVAGGRLTELVSHLLQFPEYVVTFLVICMVLAFPVTYGLSSRSILKNALVSLAISAFIAIAAKSLGGSL